MLVVSDTDDVFLPKPTDLLVNLVECRSSLESLLGRINDMFQDNLTVGSAMGPALQAGFKLVVSLARIPLRLSNTKSRFPLVVKSWSSLHLCRILVPVL